MNDQLLVITIINDQWVSNSNYQWLIVIINIIVVIVVIFIVISILINDDNSLFAMIMIITIIMITMIFIIVMIIIAAQSLLFPFHHRLTDWRLRPILTSHFKPAGRADHLVTFLVVELDRAAAGCAAAEKVCVVLCGFGEI